MIQLLKSGGRLSRRELDEMLRNVEKMLKNVEGFGSLTPGSGKSVKRRFHENSCNQEVWYLRRMTSFGFVIADVVADFELGFG